MLVLAAEEKVIPPYEEGRIGLSWSCKETGLCQGSLYLELCCLCISPHPKSNHPLSNLLAWEGGLRFGIPVRLMEGGTFCSPFSMNTQGSNLH